MKHIISLANLIVQPSGAIETHVSWNGNETTTLFSNAEQLAEVNAELLTDPAVATRWLLCYLLAAGYAADNLESAIGKTLTVDLRPAVQQTVSLT